MPEYVTRCARCDRVLQRAECCNCRLPCAEAIAGILDTLKSQADAIAALSQRVAELEARGPAKSRVRFQREYVVDADGNMKDVTHVSTRCHSCGVRPGQEHKPSCTCTAIMQEAQKAIAEMQLKTLRPTTTIAGIDEAINGPKRCTCSTAVLMSAGCQCGGQ